MLATIIAFTAYFMILLAIAIAARRKVTSDLEFVSGGRTLNYWVTSLSAHASDMSSWLFLAFPMLAYTQGREAMWVAGGLMLGMLACWQIVAPRLRVLSEQYDAYTISSFIEKRFHDKSGTIRKLSALLMVLYLMIYIASGLIGMGRLFESLFGINYYIGMSLCGVAVLSYALIGGFIAVAWTDFFQAVFLLSMLFVVVFAVSGHIGGLDTVWETINSHHFAAASSSTFESIVMAITWGLGYLGMPHILNKFISIKNPKDISKSRNIGLLWQLLCLGTAFYVGIAGLTFFSEPLTNPEMLFPQMVRSLFNPFFSGFILCAVLAASISTMDSQFVVVSSLIAENFDKTMNRSKARLALFAAFLVTFVIALTNTSSVMNVVFYAWNGLGCTVGPVLLAALYLPNTKKEGVIAGLLCGAVISLLFPVFVPTFPPMIPGFVCSLLAIVAVSFVRVGASDKLVAG